MIFVILGSQMFQFNRLLQELDRLTESGQIKDEIYAQTGYSDYQPKHYHYQQFYDRDDFDDMVKKSNYVITHSGTGAIMSAVLFGKKVIAVPRRSEYGEHVDNHQLQILKQFDEMNIVIPCYKMEQLEDLIRTLPEYKLAKYKKNNQHFIDDIDQYLATISRKKEHESMTYEKI